MDWIMAHPWMTFFLALATLEAVSNIVAAICSAIAARRGKESGETTDILES